MLADGRFHSGEKLASRLGCSRASVWNRAREVESLGLALARVRGRGYCLAEPLDLIDRDALATLLARLRWPLRVEVLDRCASTNTLLLERALNGAAHASAIACEHQTAGRGRRGAAWISTIGGSLAFSLLWRFQKGAGALSGLSLAVAVGAARALEPIAAGPIGVKWPNDLLLGEGKLGGILIEMSGDYLGPSAAVIGVGLNVSLNGGARRSVAVPAADLAGEGLPPSRTLLLARVLEKIAGVLEQFEQEGFAPFRSEWLARHAWQGKRVELKLADRHVAEGKVVGVDEEGALLLRSRRGLARFHAGELSLRRA
jgi:BirA family biotin operon repressor/biotin-[acetyl-CoA-carboxylase] ligase